VSASISSLCFFASYSVCRAIVFPSRVAGCVGASGSS
jgi:hypothetical protein